uniref:Uncharacterized protein LOC111105141 n=1 Tax=Crassostrea virginica TaxID=6565 RepID=A0A8B8AUM8_CRAVI|nr:uncharacterized protein LOC111105141 [Crassostrea virginica]
MCVKRSLWTLILFVSGGAQLSVAFCDGKFGYKPCCTGEQWNSTEGKCVSCPLNHYGENCSFTCSLPEKGYRCKAGHCGCNRVSCNVTITSSQCSNYQNLNSTRKPDTSIPSVNQVKTRLQDKLGSSGMAAFMFIASVVSGVLLRRFNVTIACVVAKSMPSSIRYTCI